MAVCTQSVEMVHSLVAQPNPGARVRRDHARRKIHFSATDIVLEDMHGNNVNAGTHPEVRMPWVDLQCKDVIECGLDGSKHGHVTIAEAFDRVSSIADDKLAALSKVRVPDLLHPLVANTHAQRSGIHNVGKNDRQNGAITASPFREGLGRGTEIISHAPPPAGSASRQALGASFM